MALYPDVQRRAQDELDRVVGSDRLPEFDDLDNMPYIRATVMEAMRWMPVTPFGVPHAVMEDDLYKGYYIPHGCVVIAVSIRTTSLISSDCTDPLGLPEHMVHSYLLRAQ